MRFLRQARSRRARWAVPAAAVAVTGVVIAGTTIGSAGAAPVLPAKTPAQLLAAVAGTHAVPPLTGTVVETTSLGLPRLPETGNPTSLSSLLTGSHTVKVYWRDAKHFRLAVPQSLSETDVIRNGSTAWLWESSRNTATKYTVPSDNSNKIREAARAHAKRAAGRIPAGGIPAGGIPAGRIPAGGVGGTAPLTPQQAAKDILAKVGKTTVVSTRSNVDVAGEPAYQLSLAPKDARSTIGSVRIAIDGKTGVPLRLQVFPRGGAAPAFQVGYTSISYTAPSPANFAFTPPSGATVTTPGEKNAKGAASPSAPDMAGAGTYGSGWLAVAGLPESALLPGSSGTGSTASPAPASSPGSAGNPLGGDSQQIVSAIFGSAKPVSGAWGSGRLLHTSLLNVLITGGKMYVGAVDPSVLEAAVGHTR